MKYLICNALIIFFCLYSYAQESFCKNGKIPNSVPVCPANGKYLDDSYPTAALFISDTTMGEEFVLKIIDTAIQENHQLIPSIFVASESKCKYVDKYLDSLPKDKRKIWENNIICQSMIVTNWQQDFFQSTFNAKTGLPEINFLEAALYSENIDFKKIIQNKCPNLVVGRNYSIPKELDSFARPKYYYGGNIEALPGGRCIFGAPDAEDLMNDWEMVLKFRSDTSLVDQIGKDTDFWVKSFHQSACFDSNPLVLDTSFLSVGHVDEIYKVIPDESDSECKYKILIADPYLGEQILSTIKDQIIFTNNLSTRKMLMEDRWPTGFICQEWLKNKNLPSVPIDPCFNMTGTDFLYLYKKYFGISNDLAAKKMIKNTKRIHSALPFACSQSIVRVPVLFGKIFSNGTFKKNDVSLFPNIANSITIGSKNIFPQQHFKPFDNFIQDLEKFFNFSMEVVDTVDAHILQGNLHCSTNIVRYCRPIGPGVL